MSEAPSRPTIEPRSKFSAFVRARSADGELVVQPRMGFGSPERMREGLARVRAARAVTVGTITVDSFTRVGDYAAAEQAIAAGTELNGYPLLAVPAQVSAAVVAGLLDDDFPVQVRHGTPCPQRVFEAMLAMGLSATEGGPVSYALPYGRVPLVITTQAWAEGCDLLSRSPDAHIESFGGCMLGQLCPPSLLVALSILEAMFVREHGVLSVSLSYAQQTNAEQDVEALQALRLLARELLDDMDWHVVLYSFMGAFPASAIGARRLSDMSVRIALAGDADRLIVKTPAEAHRIPTIAENVEALEAAHDTARALGGRRIAERSGQRVAAAEVFKEARALIVSALRLAGNIGECLMEAFYRGLLDVPFCLHPDNRNESRPHLDGLGRLSWASSGSMPVVASREHAIPCSSAELLGMLAFNASKFDAYASERAPEPVEDNTRALFPARHSEEVVFLEMTECRSAILSPAATQVPPTAFFEFSDDSRDTLLSEFLYRPNPALDIGGSLPALHQSFARLPHHAVRAIRDFASEPDAPGVMLLHNLPIDPVLPTTPADGKPSIAKATFVSDCVVLGLGASIGEPLGYTTEKDGQIVHDIVAVPDGERSQTNQSSAVFLSFHNDTTHDDSGFYHRTNPDFLVLVCLRDSPDGGGRTAYVDARWLTEILDGKVIAALRRPEFRMNAPGTYCREHADGADVWSNPVPIIDGPVTMPEITVAANGVQPLTTSAMKAWQALQDVCNRDGVAFRTVLKPGDALIINNRKGLHAREPFKADYAGGDRWLQRCYVRRSLWSMRHRATSDYRIYF